MFVTGKLSTLHVLHGGLEHVAETARLVESFSSGSDSYHNVHLRVTQNEDWVHTNPCNPYQNVYIRDFVDGNSERNFYTFIRSNQEQLRKMQLSALWQPAGVEPAALRLNSNTIPC